MADRMIYWMSVALSAVALVLLLINVSLINGNRNLQDEIAKRQATINNGITMSQLDQSLAQALAQASVSSNNQDIRQLLAGQGITIKNNKTTNNDADTDKSK